MSFLVVLPVLLRLFLIWDTRSRSHDRRVRPRSCLFVPPPGLLAAVLILAFLILILEFRPLFLAR